MTEERPSSSTYMEMSAENPFKLPPDEKIFTFREEERDRRMEEKEKNSSLKIWERSQPDRAGSLRKMLDEEIEPTPLAINPSVKKKITVAEAASAAIPHERPKKMENRFRVIDKKRDMFLVQMMLDIKKKEIQKLEKYANLREDGLNCSEKLLETQLHNFAEFLEKDKNECHQAMEKAEAMVTTKGQKVLEIKTLTEEFANTTSDVNKNLENLNNYYNYRHFLEKMKGDDFVEEQERKRQERLKRKRKQNLMEDSQDKERIKKGSKRETSSIMGQGALNLGEGNQPIPQHLQDLIDDSEDELELQFDKPEELYEIFTNYEEQNLFLIQNTQETDHSLELLRKEFQIQKEKKEKNITRLEGNYNEIKRTYDDVNSQCKQLEEILCSGTNLGEDQGIFIEIRKDIKKIYEKEKKGDSRMAPLQMLTNIERSIDGDIKKLEELIKINKDGVKAQENIAKSKNNKNRIENKMKAEEAERLKKKADREKLKESTKNFKQMGKKVMGKSRPLIKKREKVVTKEIDQEELKNQKYFLQGEEDDVEE